MADILQLAALALLLELAAIATWRTRIPEFSRALAVLGGVCLCSAIGRAAAVVWP